MSGYNLRGKLSNSTGRPFHHSGSTTWHKKASRRSARQFSRRATQQIVNIATLDDGLREHVGFMLMTILEKGLTCQMLGRVQRICTWSCQATAHLNHASSLQSYPRECNSHLLRTKLPRLFLCRHLASHRWTEFLCSQKHCLISSNFEARL